MGRPCATGFAGAKRDTDARADCHRLTREYERRVKRAHHSFSHLQGLRLAFEPVEQHRELVTAESRRRVGRTQTVLEALTDLTKQLVACGVPQRVVDGLEGVE